MNRSLKNIILIVAGIVTVLCVWEGTSRHIGNNFLGGWLGMNNIHFGSDDAKNYGDGSSESTVLGDVTEVNIDMSLGEVVVVKGSQNSIEITSNVKEITPQYSLENGCLKVWQKSNQRNVTPVNMEVKVTVTVKDSLKKLSGKLNLGDMSVDGVECDTMDIELDLGDLEISGGAAKDLTAQNDLGNVELHKVDFETADVDCSLGNLEVELVGDYDDYNMDLTVSLGDLSIGKSDVTGHYNTGGGEKTLKADVDMGDLEVYR